MRVQAGRAPVTGTELYYEAAGEGDWVVLAHGGEGTRIHWWQQVPAFGEHFRCLTYDARGFGSSPVGAPRSSDNPMRDDLVELLDHLGIERALLLGHSMGGLPVSGLAFAHPERVRGLVMSDTPFNFATLALATWADQMISKLTAGFEVLDHLYAPAFARRRPDLYFLYNALNRLNTRPDGPKGLDAYEGWRSQAVVDYGGFSVPTLFIVGTEDELTLPSLIRATAEAVGGSLLVEIDGAGHSGYAERPDVFNEAVLTFFRSLA